MKRLLPVVFILALFVVYAGPLFGSQTASVAQAPSTSQTVTTVPGTIQPPADGAPGQKAIAVTTVPSPAAPQNPLDQIVWAAAASYVIQFLKKWKLFGLISDESTSRAKAVFAFFVAVGTAAGIHFVINGSPFDSNGTTITITGLSFDAFKDVGFQWLSQQMWYDGLVKKANLASFT